MILLDLILTLYFFCHYISLGYTIYRLIEQSLVLEIRVLTVVIFSQNRYRIYIDIEWIQRKTCKFSHFCKKLLCGMLLSAVD